MADYELLTDISQYFSIVEWIIVYWKYPYLYAYIQQFCSTQWRQNREFIRIGKQLLSNLGLIY